MGRAVRCLPFEACRSRAVVAVRSTSGGDEQLALGSRRDDDASVCSVGLELRERSRCVSQWEGRSEDGADLPGSDEVVHPQVMRCQGPAVHPGCHDAHQHLPLVGGGALDVAELDSIRAAVSVLGEGLHGHAPVVFEVAVGRDVRRRLTRVHPRAAVASETRAAPESAAGTPDGLSAPEAVPATAMPMAVNTEVPSAEPTWVADPARPEASPACVSGMAPAMTMVVGVKLNATPMATRRRPGSTATV